MEIQRRAAPDKPTPLEQSDDDVELVHAAAASTVRRLDLTPRSMPSSEFHQRRPQHQVH